MKWWMKATALAAAVWATGCSAADADPSGSDEAVVETTAALQGPICNGTTRVTQCWGGVSQGQSLAFDAYSNIKWFIRVLTPTDVWPIGQFWSAGYADTFLRPTGGLPMNGKSVAVQTAFGTVTVFALTVDNVVRYSTGTAASQTSPDGTNFAHWNVYMQPLDTQGASVCLKKIVSVTQPTSFGQGRLLVGLTCGGGLVVQGAVGTEKRWMPASQHPGFVNLPSLVWRDISHDKNGGATILSESSRDVYRAGVGWITSGSGTVSWSPVTKLPQIFRNGTRIVPTQVGGRFVITNAGQTSAGNEVCTLGVGCNGDDDRFYRYDQTTNTWLRHTGGTWNVPTAQADLTTGPYYTAIVDTGTGFMVRHAFSWMIPWTD